MMTNRVCPEAASFIGALVKPSVCENEASPAALPKGMSVVMEYKVNSKGEWICFALNPDQWFDI